MKKIFIVVLISSGLLGISSNCCGDVKGYWKMDSIDLSLHDLNSNVLSDSTSTDTLVMSIATNPIFIAQEISPLNSFFVSSALALSCPAPGESGLKSKVTSISIYSDEDFNSLPAGTDLRDFCTFDMLSYSDFLDRINGSFSKYYIDIQLNSKPSQSTPRTFKVVFNFTDGAIQEATSSQIVWQ